LGESQIVALVDVHSRHDGQTLALVGVCVNRIGKENVQSILLGGSGIS